MKAGSPVRAIERVNCDDKLEPRNLHVDRGARWWRAPFVATARPNEEIQLRPKMRVQLNAGEGKSFVRWHATTIL